MRLLDILQQIVRERKRQDEKLGGPVHDDQFSTQQFCHWIKNYAGWADQMSDMGGTEGRTKARRRLIQVAALAVAAVESLDRKWPRASP